MAGPRGAAMKAEQGSSTCYLATMAVSIRRLKARVEGCGISNGVLRKSLELLAGDVHKIGKQAIGRFVRAAEHGDSFRFRDRVVG